VPEKIECRGRNGWFDYNRFNVSVYSSTTNGPITYLQISSKRNNRGWAPITIMGPAEQVLAMLEDMTGTLRDAMRKPKLEILVVIEDGNISRVVANQRNDVKVLELNREDAADDWRNEYVTEVDPEAIRQFHEPKE
jgi:hypothetical protein